MKNICIIRSNSVNPDSRVEKEAYTLQRNGYNVNILAWDRDSNHYARNENIIVEGRKIPITRLGYKASFGEGFKNLKPYLMFQFSMQRWLLINRKNYDVIHACDFDTALFSFVVAKLLRKKFVFDIFDFLRSRPKNLPQKIIRWLQFFIVNHADGTIICSEERMGQIKGTHPKNICVIHNTPMKTTKIDTKVDNKYPTVAYVGVLQDYRLLEEVLDYFSKHDEYIFNIGGFGKYEKLVEEYSKKNENINFFGRIPYESTLELEAKSDIILAIYDPSIGNHYYAAPNKFYEALMLGKPLIMVKGTGMSKYVSDNSIGELIDYSEEGFEVGLNNLIAQRSNWEYMSLKMNDLYDKDFSWDIMSVRLISFYKSL